MTGSREEVDVAEWKSGKAVGPHGQRTCGDLEGFKGGGSKKFDCLTRSSGVRLCLKNGERERCAQLWKLQKE